MSICFHFKVMMQYAMRGQKAPPYQFFSSKIFCLVVLTLLPHYCKISRPNIKTKYHSQIIELERRPPLKKIIFFWSNLYKIDTMVASLVKMLVLQTLATWPCLQYNLRLVTENFVSDVMNRNYNAIANISKYL